MKKFWMTLAGFFDTKGYDPELALSHYYMGMYLPF